MTQTNSRGMEDRAGPGEEKSMIERVARAICGGNPDELQRVLILTDMGELGVQGTYSANVKEPAWMRHVKAARAAIAAMRDIPESFCEGRAEHFDNEVTWGTARKVRSLWGDLIDAILSSPDVVRPSHPTERNGE